jgi:hypothetical protein
LLENIHHETEEYYRNLSIDQTVERELGVVNENLSEVEADLKNVEARNLEIAKGAVKKHFNYPAKSSRDVVFSTLE